MRRVRFGAIVLFILALSLLGAPLTRAQFTADFQTNTISGSGVTSNWVGTFYIVGSNTMFDALRIINGAVLSNGSCVIGWAVGGSNNVAIVSDLGSAMSNRFELYLGNDGAYNRLVVTNRGLVSSGHGYLGFNLFGTQNVALVSDTGSVWRVKTNLCVGYVDGANHLVLSNGAVVSDLLGMIGSNANLNTVLITSPGSMWSNSVSLVTGYIGSKNQLIVTNGGVAWSGHGIIGDANISRSNVVTVVGSGSTWRNTNALYVGFLGSSNTLAIANGAVANAISSYIGVDPVSTGNTAIVTGSGSIWSNSVNTYVGYAGVGNQLIVTNAGKVWDQSGSIGFTNSATGNLALIEGAVSVWSNTLTCYIGYNSTGNQLIVSNGATVFGKTNYVGVSSAASNNTAIIVGAGARWTTTNLLHVGYQGSANTLIIADGGRTEALETRVGHDPVASNNTALLTGSGALMSNTLNTIVGYGGYGNQLIVSNGATVLDQVGAVGYTNQSSGNSALITGIGSMWSNVESYVGYKSAGNQLIVADGGAVLDADTHIGTFANSSNNVALVTGVDSVWNNTGYLHVGELGSSNMLTVADGGTAVAGLETRVGWDDTSSNNVLTVTGSGALLSNTVNTLIGVAGPLNRLVLSNAAVIWDQAGIVGYSNSANRSVAIVDGGVWSNTVNFQVGYKGSFNQLIVTNGGKVYSSDSWIGTFNISSSNTAIITGPGSRWSSTNSLFVGQDGRSNSLIIASGGAVSDVFGYLGYDATGITNTALVTGSGATWTNTTALYVGVNGLGNSLVISNGGTVYANNYCEIGYAATSDRNSVLVTGPGATWANNLLYIGDAGASNTVTIANGGTAYGITSYASTHYVGYSAASISNTVLVTDPGSSWNVNADFFIGYSSRSNSLTIANGGTVDCVGGYVGGTTGTNNFALVTGSGSKWTAQSLYVGFNGARNSLVVSNGGVALTSSGGYVGYASTAGAGISNSALVANTGSVWSNNGTLYIGYSTRGNSLIVSNGGAAYSAYAGSVGYATSTGADGSNNVGLVTGPGSLWNNGASLTVGDGSHSNRLTAALLGKVAAANIFVGARGGTNNLLRLTNGLAQASTVNVGTGNYLTGSGTVTGNLVNNGTIAANINGATLTFNNLVKNNGALLANGGGIIEFYGPVLNFGTTNFTGGSAIFYAGIFSANGTTNSWTFAGSDVWQTSNRWSRAVPPSPADSLVLITNATTKTVTVTASTFSAAPNSVNNFSIAMSGPANVTNTLRVADTPAGTNFTAIYFDADTNTILIVSNATMQVGAFGTGAFTAEGELRVEAGGQLDTTGVATSTVGNVTVSGVGASWSNGLLIAGLNGRLSVTGGGKLFNSGGTVLDSNVVGTVAGSSSTWITTSSLTVGNNGAGNQLTITNGGGLVTSSVYLGGAASSSNNVMTITGNGSVWTNQISLQIGSGGAANQLIITNGGRFVNFAFVSQVGNSANNVVTLTGTNSVWTDYSYFYFGNVGGGNRLTIADGALLNAATGPLTYMGINISSSNNAATVTGSNSLWNTSLFYLGYQSAGNSLTLTNGGTAVVNGTGLLGYYPSSSNNVVTVSGSNSLWRTPFTFYIGYAASSNRVEIAGGSVVAGSMVISYGDIFNGIGSNNLVRVSSGDLFVTNSAGAAPLTVSAAGTGPAALILSGGAVTIDKLIAANGANSIVTFNAGTLSTKTTVMTNAPQFVVGDGTGAATYRVLGGTHSFNNGLRIRTNATLTGCGTINGVVVVDAGGTVLADCGGTLTFTGSVTNNGTMRALNGTVIESLGPVVNNGLIDALNGGTNFLSTLVNNGVIITSNSIPQIVSVSVAGTNVQINFTTGDSAPYVVEYKTELNNVGWTPLTNMTGNSTVMSATDSGAAVLPQRFYRVRLVVP